MSARKTKAGSAPRAAACKSTLQFAPNFTAYVMPPDVVCIYSEDRKFFLHGELYCALSSAIGKGGKSARDLVAQLGKSFPADKVEEALNRMVERRYVVNGGKPADDTLAGYWASIGLPAGEAERNLAMHKVRVEAIDVKGAAELTAALGKLIQLHQKLQRAGGKLVMCKIAKDILDVFRITKLDKILVIKPDEQSGLQSF